MGSGGHNFHSTEAVDKEAILNIADCYARGQREPDGTQIGG